MSEETNEEREQRINDEAAKAVQDGIDEKNEEARKILDKQHGEGPHIETQEEYEQRVAAARAGGIFGDTDTGVFGGDQQVPTADNEAGNVAVAAADAAGADVSDDEARRQASADAANTEEGDIIGTDKTAEESKEADKDNDDEDDKKVVKPSDKKTS